MKKRVLSLLMVLAVLATTLTVTVSAGEQCEINGHSYTNKASYHMKEAATCTEAAKYFVQCDYCENISTEEWVYVGSPNGHSFTRPDSGAPAIEATCTEPAKYFMQCDNCEATSTGPLPYGEPLGHDWGEWKSLGETQHQHVCKTDSSHSETADHRWDSGEVITPATHMTEGEKKCTCQDCGETKNATIEKLREHTFDQKNTDEKYLKSEADCENPAIYYMSCECGEKGTETFTDGKALGHTYPETWEKYSDKQHQHVCTRCENEKEYADHSWDEGEVTTPATHLREGVMTYTCTECGETRTEAIDKVKEHTFDQKNTDEKYLKSEADCENPAIYYMSCECGEKGTETFTYGKALGHKYVDGKCVECGDETAEAAEPEDNDNAEVTNPDGSKDTEKPQTGDNSNMTLWMLLLVLNGLGLCAAIACRRKYN